MKLAAIRIAMGVGWTILVILTAKAAVWDITGMLYGWAAKPSSLLLWVDLVAELVIISAFIMLDARRNGRNPIPWVLVTLVLGGVGSIGYLFARTFWKGATRDVSASAP